LVHFAFLAESEPMRLADAIQHPKWQKAMNEELMTIEKNNIMTWLLIHILLLLILILLPINYFTVILH